MQTVYPIWSQFMEKILSYPPLFLYPTGENSSAGNVHFSMEVVVMSGHLSTSTPYIVSRQKTP